MSTSFKETVGFPHAETTITELEQIAEEPGDGFGRAVRGAYFVDCLRNDGSLTVFFPTAGPKILRRFDETDEENRGRLMLVLRNAVPGLTLDDLDRRIYTH